MYKNFLFDLDGTLLPMNMDEFVKLYFASLCKRFSPIVRLSPDALVNAVLKGTVAMTKNDNSNINKDVFWKEASEACNMDLTPYIEQFDDYYLTEFINAKNATSVTPYAKKCVDFAKQQGGKLIAATNPIFPEVATLRRLSWAGVSGNDFDYITTYENFGCCKPNLKYFEIICDRCGINPEESIMIGNDVDEDMCAAELGFDTYLITDCIVNRKNKDYSMYKNGSFADFYEFLTTLSE
jgi:HAD superfamily hydrolase (TIGR01549 family)